MSVLLTILTFFLILVSLFLVMVVLMQKSKDGGMGAALGGGATEAAFGAETGNVLSKSTIYAAIIFFILAFLLYLGRIYEHKHVVSSGGALPAASTLVTPSAPAPAAGAASAPAVTVTPAAPATTPAATVTPQVTQPAPATPAPETEKK